MVQTAIVTGGAQGIGRGITKKLLELGYRVAVCDIDREAGREISGLYAAAGDLTFVEMDVSLESSVRNGIDDIAKSHSMIVALVNNAGIATPFTTPIEQLDSTDWDRVIRTNLTGMFLTCKYTLPLLKENEGSVVNIASTRAVQSEPNSEAYAASKAGIVGFTHALAASAGPRVRVNCISPGWIEVSQWQKEAKRKDVNLSPQDHQQHLVGRVGEPNDIAGLVAYLISKDAGFITGQNYIVDGGMTRKMIYEP